MDAALWNAIVNCETTFDGQYFYGVLTTGIFCRPSCKSRTPRRENVRIFRSVEEAQAAGFRPCKRCCPERGTHGPDAELVDATKALIAKHYAEPLTLQTLAGELVVSPFHLHRLFKRLTGTTPAEFILRTRIQAAAHALKAEPTRTITDIALGVGFRSASHFSSVFRKVTGYTPTDYRKMHQLQL
jgi:AraC family transcriptional regulator of adaptative response / methylphosphotriester-DNA alkyltransferase methyltransferase